MSFKWLALETLALKLQLVNVRAAGGPKLSSHRAQYPPRREH